MSTEVGYTPRGNRVTLERDSRVEGPGPHVFIYDKTEGGIGLESPAEKPPSKLPMTLSVARKAIVGLPNRVVGTRDSMGPKGTVYAIWRAPGFWSRRQSLATRLSRTMSPAGAEAPRPFRAHESPVPGWKYPDAGHVLAGGPSHRRCVTSESTTTRRRQASPMNSQSVRALSGRCKSW